MAYPNHIHKRRHYPRLSLAYHNPTPFRLWQASTRMMMEDPRLAQTTLRRPRYRTYHLNILHTRAQRLADADLVR